MASGTEIVVGGSGTDSLIGGTGEDLLIGGTLSYLNEGNGQLDATGLADVKAEWTRTDVAYAGRIANLSTGAGLSNGNAISASSVGNDGAADTLTGGGNLDWFVISPLDVMTDKLATETATNI